MARGASPRHAGATVQGEPVRKAQGPHGLPLGSFTLVEVDPESGEPVREVRVPVEGWPYFTGQAFDC